MSLPNNAGASPSELGELLRVCEAAQILKYSVKHVERMVRSGKIPATKIGRFWLIPREALKRHVQRILHEARTNKLK